MPEIMLRDLCRWDRRLSVMPPTGMTLAGALDRGVSWAVSVRAAPPLLPPLRGDELVVLPLRVLEQIELGETITREQLLSTLAQQRIGAILTEPGFTEEPIEQLPVVTLPAPFPHDAEGTLNRMITERRAELYRLGAELSRGLSQAAVDPRGISAVLQIAAEMSGRSLQLEDGEGNVVASTGAAAMLPAQRLLSKGRVVEGSLISAEENDDEYLSVTLASSGRSGYLLMAGPSGSLTESDRLVLVQTAGMCAALLGQQTPIAGTDRGARERQVADLLFGRLATTAAALARGHALGLGANEPVFVGLIDLDGAAQEVSQVRDVLTRSIGPAAAENIAPVDRAVGVIFAGHMTDAAQRSLRQALERHGPNAAIAVSRPLPSVALVPEGVREARFALNLRRQGAIGGPVIRCGSVDDLGLYALLYPLWGDGVLTKFTASLLGELDAYDRRRKSELIPTLEAYLSAGGALSEAAEALQIHRNTLSYRLQRIAELTQRDLSDPRERLLLQVALLARRMPSETDK